MRTKIMGWLTWAVAVVVRRPTQLLRLKEKIMSTSPLALHADPTIRLRPVPARLPPRQHGPTAVEVIEWLIFGALAGVLAGMLIVLDGAPVRLHVAPLPGVASTPGSVATAEPVRPSVAPAAVQTARRASAVAVPTSSRTRRAKASGAPVTAQAVTAPSPTATGTTAPSPSATATAAPEPTVTRPTHPCPPGTVLDPNGVRGCIPVTSIPTTGPVVP